MSIRWSLFIVLSLCVCQTALAQPLSPKTIVWNQRNPQSEAYFGIVGEIARPGVYVSRSSQATLQELIQKAGGLTRQGSPAVRIVRNGRAGQSVFYRPGGQDLLAPNDLVVIDVLRDPRQSLSAGVSERSDRNVWIGLVGISDRPEVVWVNPDQAQLPNVMLMLGQSAALAKSVRTILAPRLPQASDLFDLLPNGAVLVFDHSLLVTANLPEFAAAHSLHDPVANVATVPTPPQTMPTADSVSMPQQDVNAQPIPFVADLPDQVSAAPASLPAPGSRFAPTIPAAPPAQSATNIELPPPAAPPILVEAEPDIEPEIVGIPAVAPKPKATLGLWQMLGIGSTVASLVGIALMSRQYLDRTANTAAATPVKGWSRNAQDLAAARPSLESANEIDPTPSPMVDDDLSAVLNHRADIETEAAEFPARMSLASRSPQPIYRLDAAAESVAVPHFVSGAATAEQTFFTDVAAESSIPAPHFRRRPSRAGAEAVTADAAPAAQAAGSAIERALSQLQEGLKS